MEITLLSTVPFAAAALFHVGNAMHSQVRRMRWDGLIFRTHGAGSADLFLVKTGSERLQRSMRLVQRATATTFPIPCSTLGSVVGTSRCPGCWVVSSWRCCPRSRSKACRWGGAGLAAGGGSRLQHALLCVLCGQRATAWRLWWVKGASGAQSATGNPVLLAAGRGHLPPDPGLHGRQRLGCVVFAICRLGQL